MSDIILRTASLCRHYRRGIHEIRAVDDINLQIESGEFVAVVGASGSGKSTLLNLLAGLDSPTAGKVTYRNKILNELSRRELATYRAEKVGMIFQSFNLLQHQSALKNVELALYFNHIPRNDREKRAKDILIRLGLEDRIEHKPADLSGGEQQRVAIARALVKKPELLFADEPTGNLDRENSEAIAEILKELNGEGLTVVIVTHDTELAGRIAGRTVRMHYGKIAGGESG